MQAERIHISDAQVMRMPLDDLVVAVDAAFRALGRGEIRNPPREERLGRPGDPDYFRIELVAEWRLPSGEVHCRCRKIIEEAGATDALGAHTPGLRTARIELSYVRRDLAIVLDGEAITNIRTGIAALLGARYLLPDGHPPIRLAVIGAGRVAREVVRAAPHVLPVADIRVTSRGAESRERLVVDLMPGLAAPLRAVDSVAACADGADVVVAAVPSREPVLRASEVGARHVSLVAGDPRVVLADRPLWEGRRCIPDDGDQAENTGDVVRARAEGWADRICWTGIDGRRATIADAALGRVDRSGAPTMAVFTGMAALDMAVVMRAWERYGGEQAKASSVE